MAELRLRQRDIQQPSTHRAHHAFSRTQYAYPVYVPPQEPIQLSWWSKRMASAKRLTRFLRTMAEVGAGEW
jgi:hypothetical protein